MKIPFPFCVLFLCLMFFGCSDDDSNTNNPEIEGNFFPLVIGNSWDYSNLIMTPGEADITSNETLSVINSSTNGSQTTYDLETDNPVGTGIFTSALDQGTLSKINENLIFTGSLVFSAEELPSLSITLNDAPIFNLNSSPDTILYTSTLSTNETVEGIPLTLDYKIETIMGNYQNSLTVNGMTYAGVINSQIILTLEIKASALFPVLSEQEVVVINNYYAEDIGLILSETNVNFDFIDLDNIPLPIEDFSLSTSQSIESYSVELD